MHDKKIYGKIKEVNFKNIQTLFDSRTESINSPLHAIMLQNQDSDLPVRRNLYEQEIILTEILINQDSKVLDLGCGYGRIAQMIPNNISYYYGLDFSEKFIRIAQQNFLYNDNFFFSNYDVTNFYNNNVIKYKKFNVVFIVGTMMYLNDFAVSQVYTNILDYLEENKSAVIYIRESVSLLEDRITLDNFYSDKLESNYSAIYRTDAEYKNLFKIFESKGFYLSKSLLFDESLANNSETKQKFYILRRD
ncbi:class I SAM-dependent methyltransferase [Candidatus Tisiphia endosymbiont of Beris chalybata]|uniref:class I SAM-dependent methyltransferase n=1 Tax=Candidatus Tisiphia endosymbiont of Beris chalybata TaxID=3066262 RepID=UPI00312CA527